MKNIIRKIIQNIKNIELNYSILSCLLIILVIHFISAGYSSFNTSIRINNLSAKVRASYPLRVTDFKINTVSDGAISHYEEYDVNNLYTRVKLPTLDSYVIYDIEVTNYDTIEAGIQNIYFENDYLDYELIDYKLFDTICDTNDSDKCTEGAKKKFQLLLKYKDSVTEPQEPQELNMDVWFTYPISVTYYGIDSTNLKKQIMSGADFTEKLDIDIANLKVIMGWGEVSINTDEWATYQDGVLYLKEAYAQISIYNVQPLEIKTLDEYEPDDNDDITYTYEITNKNDFDITYYVTSYNSNLNIDEIIFETIKAHETATKSIKAHVQAYGDSTLKYILQEPFYDNIDVPIRIKNKNVKYLKVDLNYQEQSSSFLGGPIKRSEIESVSFLGVTSIPEDALGSFDVSYEDGAKLTWAWYFDNDNNGLYEFYISYFGEIESGERMVNIKDAGTLFMAMNNLTQINFFDENGINRFNTEDNKSLFRTFNKCYSLKTLDLSGFDTRKNDSLYETFTYDYNLEEINLGNMDTSNVESAWRTFSDCRSLKSIDVSSFNTSKITEFGEMFLGCSSLKELDVSGFDTSKAYGVQAFIRDCTSLEKIDLSGFDTSLVTDYSGLFYNAPHITTEFTIRSNNFKYEYANPFYYTATDGTAKVTINYTAENKEKVEAMVNGKSSNSNVVLGVEVP